MKVLGSIITNDESRIVEFVNKKIDKVERDLEIILHESMPVQSAVLLLRSSLNINARMDYLMRVLPYKIIQPSLERFDKIMLNSMKRILQLDTKEMTSKTCHRLRLNIKLNTVV